MKIVTNDRAYVQINDLSFLRNHADLVDIPSSVVEKVFCKPFECTNRNKYQFIEFNQSEEIEFFNDLDYSVNYLEFKCLTDEEIRRCANKLIEKRNVLCDEIKKLKKEYESISVDWLFERESLEFKINSLKEIMFFNQGKLKMKLPEQYRTVKGIKRFFKRFKKR